MRVIKIYQDRQRVTDILCRVCLMSVYASGILLKRRRGVFVITISVVGRSVEIFVWNKGSSGRVRLLLNSGAQGVHAEIRNNVIKLSSLVSLKGSKLSKVVAEFKLTLGGKGIPSSSASVLSTKMWVA